MSVVLSPNAATLTTEGVLRYEFLGERIDLPIAQALLAAGRSAMADDVRPRPTLVVIHRAAVDQAARRYFSFSKESRQTSSRVAIVAGNPIARVIGNFFVGLNRSDIPTRLFGDEAGAVQWLLT